MSWTPCIKSCHAKLEDTYDNLPKHIKNNNYIKNLYNRINKKNVVKMNDVSFFNDNCLKVTTNIERLVNIFGPDIYKIPHVINNNCMINFNHMLDNTIEYLINSNTKAFDLNKHILLLLSLIFGLSALSFYNLWIIVSLYLFIYLFTLPCINESTIINDINYNHIIRSLYIEIYFASSLMFIDILFYYSTLNYFITALFNNQSSSLIVKLAVQIIIFRLLFKLILGSTITLNKHNRFSKISEMSFMIYSYITSIFSCIYSIVRLTPFYSKICKITFNNINDKYITLLQGGGLPLTLLKSMLKNMSDDGDGLIVINCASEYDMPCMKNNDKYFRFNVANSCKINSGMNIWRKNHVAYITTSQLKLTHQDGTYHSSLLSVIEMLVLNSSQSVNNIIVYIQCDSGNHRSTYTTMGILNLIRGIEAFGPIEKNMKQIRPSIYNTKLCVRDNCIAMDHLNFIKQFKKIKYNNITFNWISSHNTKHKYANIYENFSLIIKEIISYVIHSTIKIKYVNTDDHHDYKEIIDEDGNLIYDFDKDTQLFFTLISIMILFSIF